MTGEEKKARIQYDARGHPIPLGVRGAALKMALIIGQTEKGVEPLTPDETRYITAVAHFFADEYTRISDGNEQLTARNNELETINAELVHKLMEIHRLAQTEAGE